jgi:hypothetical protein
MKTIILSRTYTDEEVKNRFHKKFLSDDSYNKVIQDDCDAYNNNGELLFKFRKNVIPFNILKLGYESFKDAIVTTDGRGSAAGGIFKRGKVKAAINYVQSGPVGFMDRTNQMPYCRQTAFNKNYFEQFQRGIPFVKQIDKLYEKLCPEHYLQQIKIVKATNRNYVIDGTSFTTVTINKNFITAVHKDNGDLPQGFGNLCVYREGEFEGAYFCMPEYSIAIDLQNSDMLFVDVHRWHGNTPIRNASPDYLRISFIMYYRENMIACKSPSEELARIKKERGGFYRL